MMTFVPIVAICACTARLAPSPMLTIAMTAATPMTIPSIVSPARSRFRAKIRSAVRIVSHTNADI